MDRSTLLSDIADQIHQSKNGNATLVAIDGRDGSGKTVFANELAQACKQRCKRNVIRISIDDFHHPKSIRYRLGPKSPQGFWEDSYDYHRFHKFVTQPLGANGSGQYKPRSHDLETDKVLDDEPWATAPLSSIVIVDGLFLHRHELVDAWDMSIFLDVSPEVCAERMMLRDGDAPKLVPEDRYFGGLLLYTESCHPKDRASIVVDNSVFASPLVVKKPFQ